MKETACSTREDLNNCQSRSRSLNCEMWQSCTNLFIKVSRKKEKTQTYCSLGCVQLNLCSLISDDFRLCIHTHTHIHTNLIYTLHLSQKNFSSSLPKGFKYGKLFPMSLNSKLTVKITVENENPQHFFSGGKKIVFFQDTNASWFKAVSVLGSGHEFLSPLEPYTQSSNQIFLFTVLLICWSVQAARTASLAEELH